MKNTTLSLVLCLLLSASLSAQEWTYHSHGKQLSGIVETDQATWVATIGGLVKIDQLSGDTLFFNTTNSPLPFNWINGVVEDSENNIWGSTHSFFFKIENEEWTIYDLGLNSSSTVGMTIDTEDNIWYYSSSGANGLFKIKDGQILENYTVDNFGLPADNINDLIVREDGTLYVATKSNGIGIYKDNNWTYYNANNSNLPDASIKGLALADDETIWVASESGVSFIENGMISNIDPGLPNTPFRAKGITIDAEGNVWVIDNALYQYDGLEWQRIVRSGLPVFGVETYHFIANGVNNEIFLGITQTGLFAYDKSDWYYINTSNSKLQPLNVKDISITPNDDKFIVGTLGTTWVTDGNWQLPYEGESMLPNDRFNACAIDKDGVRWFGSQDGLASYHDGIWRVYKPSNSLLPSNYITSIEIDELNRKWIGTDLGLAIWDDEEWQAFTSANSELPDDYIYDIELDGNIAWLGTKADFLTRFDGNTWQNIPSNSANSVLCDDGCKIYDLALAADGTVWGVAEGILFKYENNTFSVITNVRNAGAYSSSNVAIDNVGVLWVGLTSGIGKYDPNLEEFTFYEKEGLGRHFFHVFDIEIDLLGNKWIAAHNGIFKFHEEAIVALEEVEVDGDAPPVAVQNIFPNPTPQLLNIDFKLREPGELTFEIVDLLGKRLSSTPLRRYPNGSNSLQLNLESLAPGCYFLVGRDGRGQVFYAEEVIVAKP